MSFNSLVEDTMLSMSNEYCIRETQIPVKKLFNFNLFN